MSAGKEKIGIVGDGNQSNELSIGVILTRSGRLKVEDAVRIIQHQRQKNIRFGDAAVELGLLEENDIRFALAQQFGHAYVAHGDSSITLDVIAAYQPESAEVEALRALRSYLMVRWFNGAQALAHKTLAIVGPDSGAGRSWLAANLAVIFSQLGKQTVLVDCDLRNSDQHRLFGVDNRQGLSDVLLGRVPLATVLRQNQLLDKLILVPAGVTPPNPQEVLARDELDRFFDVLRSTADVIILDTPADGQCADGQIVATRARGAIVVAKRNSSRPAVLRGYADLLRAASVDIVASVLTDK